MTTAASDSTVEQRREPPRLDPRDRSMQSWRARLGVLASRGETSWPRVEQCRAALSVWRLRTFLLREMNMSDERADELIDRMLADEREREAATR